MTAAVVLTASVIAGARWLYPDTKPWHERVDRVCFASYEDMLEAREQKAPLSQLADISTRTAAQLEAFGSDHEEVPTSALIPYADYVRTKWNISVLRRQLAEQGATASRRKELETEQRAASTFARGVPGLSTCGHVGPELE